MLSGYGKGRGDWGEKILALQPSERWFIQQPQFFFSILKKQRPRKGLNYLPWSQERYPDNWEVMEREALPLSPGINLKLPGDWSRGLLHIGIPATHSHVEAAVPQSLVLNIAPAIQPYWPKAPAALGTESSLHRLLIWSAVQPEAWEAGLTFHTAQA